MAGSNKMIGGGGFHHLSMKVHDFGATYRFYTEGLGFKDTLSWGEGERRTVLLDTGDGNYLEVSAGGPSEAKPQGIVAHFALRTEDCDRALQRARQAGAEVTVEPKSVTIPSEPPLLVRIAFCKGPSGELIEFFQNDRT